MGRRLVSASVLAMALIVTVPGAALACGGLVAPGHAEVLRRATTLAAWHSGYEHYVTGFQFVGSAEHFGYIIPLPGVPAKIEKGGGWTLERLDREVNPVFTEAVALAAAAPRAKDVEVLQRVTVDALNITVVRGGGPDVAAWAKKNGFDLTPDTPRVMSAYSSRGAIFALAKFDNKKAVKRGFVEGQGTVIHFTIPTKAPWIPLRILALGKAPTEQVNADLYVLTDDRPSLKAGPSYASPLRFKKSEAASSGLLADLRSDRGMKWLPAHGMWFTALTLEAPAATVSYDLSIDGGGPAVPAATHIEPPTPASTWWILSLVLVGAGAMIFMLWRPAAPPVRPA
jgi:hypothetical protein